MHPLVVLSLIHTTFQSWRRYIKIDTDIQNNRNLSKPDKKNNDVLLTEETLFKMI